MKKFLLIIFSTFALNANAQTTQGIDPTLVSDICVFSFIYTDSTGFHWTVAHEKATSPTVEFYTLDKYENSTWNQEVFHTSFDPSVFILDTVPFDSTSGFRLTSYDGSQNIIYQNLAKPIFIRSIEESVSHTALTFSRYIGFAPNAYIIYRGHSPVDLVPYDTIAASPNAVINYFDPEADSWGWNYYQIGAMRASPCDISNQSGWGAYTGIAFSDIALAGTVGVNEQALLNNITLYPNPAQNNITVNLSKQPTEGVSINVLNPMGQLVQTTVFDKSAGQKLTVDVATLPTGIYFVQVQAFGGVKAFRLVKN